MTRVVVVGGGITGLTAARQLIQAGLEVTLVESGARWGGKVDSTRIDGVRLDTGAESLLARRPEGLELIADLGLVPVQVHPTSARPRLLVEGTLCELPPSVVGVPSDLEALRPLLTEAGFAEAARRSSVATTLDQDVAIGAAVDESFGPEVTDRLLEPLLGGIYAGRARELSFAAAAHALFSAAQQSGSLLEHARGVARPSDAPVFAGLTGGLAGLVDALVAGLEGTGAELRLDSTARAIQRQGSAYEVTLQRGHQTEAVRADAVLLAAPAGLSGRLLQPHLSSAAAYAAIPYASVAVVTTVVEGVQTEHSGLLLPPGERPSIKAVTYSSNKWDWVAEAARQTWGEDVTVARLSLGRLGEERLLQAPDTALVARTLAEAATLPGWEQARPVRSEIRRWGGSLPQYQVGHRSLIGALQDELTGVPGLAVAGAAVNGVGIAACLGSARSAVTKLMADLGTERGGMETPVPPAGPATQNRTNRP